MRYWICGGLWINSVFCNLAEISGTRRHACQSAVRRGGPDIPLQLDTPPEMRPFQILFLKINEASSAWLRSSSHQSFWSLLATTTFSSGRNLFESHTFICVVWLSNIADAHWLRWGPGLQFLTLPLFLYHPAPVSSGWLQGGRPAASAPAPSPPLRPPRTVPATIRFIGQARKITYPWRP